MKVCLGFLITFLLVFNISGANEVTSLSPSGDEAELTGLSVEKINNSATPTHSDGTDQDSTIFFEDFEIEPTDWETLDLTDIGPQWHPDTFNAYSGNSWWCGDAMWNGYFNLWLQYLITPTLDLSVTSNTQLSFKIRWAMESTTAFPPPPPYNGWDGCNVWVSTDNGTNWDVIEPVSPAYTCTDLSAFGTVWGFGPGIPGWADSSGGWQNATFDLSGYQNRFVKLRWALCSDRAVCSQGHPEITGFFLDDVLVVDGTDTLLWNDADGAEIPGPMTYDTGEPFGDWWEWTTMDYYSPTHSMRVDDDNFYINNALVSPPIDIPENYTTRFRYWVHCDLPDSTHSGSTSLRDYYFVEASPDGVVWDTLFYDYARGGAGYPGWNQMVPGLPYNGNIDMDLSGYAGQTIQLRFRIITDGDHTSGNGSGLFIDDVEVFVNEHLTDDVGIASFHIPFPTVLGEPVEGEVTVRNFGLNDQPSFYAFWRVDEEVFPIGTSPLWSLPGLSDSTVSVSYDPTETGSIFIDAYTTFIGDLNPANDTSWAGEVEITPSHFYEYGYDARGYSYLDTLLSLQYYQGYGPLVLFSIDTLIWFEEFRMFFEETGEFTLHVYEAGTPTEPGPEMFAEQVTISAGEVYPNWKYVFVGGMLVTDEEDFWVWLEMTQTGGGPNLIADYEHFGEGHFFDYDGNNASDTQYDFYIRAQGTTELGVSPEVGNPIPTSVALHKPHPNPFNPSTRIQFALPQAGYISMSAFDLAGREVARIVSGDFKVGNHEVIWNAALLSSGIYFVQLSTPWGIQVQKALLLK